MKLYDEGVDAKEAAVARDAQAKLDTAALKELSDAAAQSVTDAKDQRTKELLWREWLYCELGAVPTELQGLDNGTSWWKYSQDENVSVAVSQPTSCTVPAVKNEAGDADLRPAVEYFGAKSDLAAETKPADGSAW